MTDINLPELIELKPCPHCGNTQPVGRRYPGEDGFRDRLSILCHYDDGGCGAESGHYHTWIEAVSSWNRRDGITEPAIDYDCDQFKAGWKAGYKRGLVDAWIDPAVEVPDDEQTVLLYDNDGGYHVGWYRAENQDFDCDSFYVDLVDVLGWQPCVKPKGAPDVTKTD